MDILHALRADHEQALKTARRITETDDAREARTLYRELAQALAAHSRAEEAVVYAALKRTGDDAARDIAFEGAVEHTLCDQLIGEMATGRAGSDGWQARAKVVYELLQHHIEEEHDDMFKRIRRHFDAAERQRMAARFEQAKEQHLAAEA